MGLRCTAVAFESRGRAARSNKMSCVLVVASEDLLPRGSVEEMHPLDSALSQKNALFLEAGGSSRPAAAQG